MIDISNLYKTYNSGSLKVEALNGVSLHVDKADIYGVIGYSGSGKSTLIRCINQLEKPDEGSVVVDGRSLTDLSERELKAERRKIGMIFQHFNLLSRDTVFNNIALPLKYEGVSKKEIRERVDELLELVGLSEKRDAYPSQLSGGQKQRVAIARALANRPKILLSDEATSALDPQTTLSILELIKDLQKKLGLTVVVITHQMSVIREICNKVAVLNAGEIVETGTTYEIFTNPRHEITKQFIDGIFKRDRIEHLLRTNPVRPTLLDDSIVSRLVFVKEASHKALISEISRDFEIDVSIIYGNVEKVQGDLIGSLYVIFSGNHSQIIAALNHLEKNGVFIEHIRYGFLEKGETA